jgi:hypothetical protein
MLLQRTRCFSQAPPPPSSLPVWWHTRSWCACRRAHTVPAPLKRPRSGGKYAALPGDMAAPAAGGAGAASDAAVDAAAPVEAPLPQMSESLKECFGVLRAGGLSDFVVEVQGREFKSHRLLVSAHSEYFAGMLSGGLREVATGRAKLEGCTAAAWQAIHGEMYGTPWAPSTDASVADNMVAIIQIGAAAAFYQFKQVEAAAKTHLQAVLRACKPPTVWPVLSAMTAPTLYEHWPWLQVQTELCDSLVASLGEMSCKEAAPSVEAIHCIRAPALQALLRLDELDADSEDEVLAVAFTYALLRTLTYLAAPAAAHDDRAGASKRGAKPAKPPAATLPDLAALDDTAAALSAAKAAHMLARALQTDAITAPGDVLAAMTGKDLTTTAAGVAELLRHTMQQLGCVRWHMVSDKLVAGIAEQFTILTDRQIVAAYSMRHTPGAHSAKAATWPKTARVQDPPAAFTPPSSGSSASLVSGSAGVHQLQPVGDTLIAGMVQVQGQYYASWSRLVVTLAVQTVAEAGPAPPTAPSFASEVYNASGYAPSAPSSSTWPAEAVALRHTTMTVAVELMLHTRQAACYFEKRPGKWVRMYQACPSQVQTGQFNTNYNPYTGAYGHHPGPFTAGYVFPLVFRSRGGVATESAAPSGAGGAPRATAIKVTVVSAKYQ